MRPVLILQHEPTQGPGYLLQCLREHGLDVELLRPDLGDRPPAYAADFSGLVVLGSDHSVQDRLPWIARERLLLADALRLERPVLGHCFGAQQLARTLGAAVQRNPRPDIGWRELWITPSARHLFDGQERLLSFNWHHDSFQMPPGATRTLFGVHGLNKGFALGPHLGLQSHLEITDPGLRAWCAQGRSELAQCHGPTVQTEQEILADLPQRLARLRTAARAVYHHWIGHLDRRPVLARPRAA